MTKRGLDDRDLEQALHEVEILKSIAGHPNVVKILDVYEDLDTIYIVQEYLSGHTLIRYLKNT